MPPFELQGKTINIPVKVEDLRCPKCKADFPKARIKNGQPYCPLCNFHLPDSYLPKSDNNGAAQTTTPPANQATTTNENAPGNSAENKGK